MGCRGAEYRKRKIMNDSSIFFLLSSSAPARIELKLKNQTMNVQPNRQRKSRQDIASFETTAQTSILARLYLFWQSGDSENAICNLP